MLSVRPSTGRVAAGAGACSRLLRREAAEGAAFPVGEANSLIAWLVVKKGYEVWAWRQPQPSRKAEATSTGVTRHEPGVPGVIPRRYEAARDCKERRGSSRSVRAAVPAGLLRLSTRLSRSSAPPSPAILGGAVL